MSAVSMSAASGGRGNGRIAKFHKRVSEAAGCRNGETLPYAPDFLDSLVRRMSTRGGDLVERTFAWMVYRASGNQSEYAIHIYGVKGEAPVETALRQRDCALELAWLESGHRAEWLDAPLAMLRSEAARRGVIPIDKTLISDGFTENRERGTIASDTGYYLVLIPSPKVADSTEHPRRKGESREYQDFCAKWKVAHAAECEEEQVARSVIKRINRIRLSAYRESRKSPAAQTNGATSLEASKTVEASETAPLPPPSRSSLIESTNPSSSSRENDDDARPALANSSEDELLSRPKPNAEAPDPEFSRDVITVFVTGGKPSPTSRQILNLQRAIPPEPQARVAFLPYLSEKMPRIKHPGVLPDVAEEFRAAWPALVEPEQTMQASVRRSAPEVMTAETLSAYLESNAAAVPYPEIADSLRRLATDVEEYYKDLESLEQRLIILEKEMMALADNSFTEKQMAEVRQKTDGQLKEYRGKMTTAQLSMLEEQCRERNVLEQAKLPRLSLYYMR